MYFLMFSLMSDLRSLTDCTYPHWLVSKRWMTTDRQHRLTSHRQRLTLHPAHSPHSIKHFSCHDISRQGAEYFISSYSHRDSWYVLCSFLLLFVVSLQNFNGISFGCVFVFLIGFVTKMFIVNRSSKDTLK